MADHDARSQTVGQRPHRQLQSVKPPEAGAGGGDQSAVEYQAPLPDREDLAEGASGEIAVPIADDIKGAGAQESADDQPGREIVHHIPRQAGPAGVAGRHPQPGEKSQGHHHSKGMQRQVAPLEQDWLHSTRILAVLLGQGKAAMVEGVVFIRSGRSTGSFLY